MSSSKVTFSKSRRDFHNDLKERVERYFVENNLPRHATAAMVVKTIFWFSSTALLYALLLSDVLSPYPVATMATWMVLGFCLACIGFNVGHDAIHGSYSDKKWVNGLLSWSFDFMGANSYTWSIAHNFVHHTYTNIPDVDKDIEPGPFIRLYPRYEGVYWFHRYQHFYAFFLYSLVSLIWVFVKDYEQIAQRDPRTGKYAPVTEFVKLFIGKALHIGILLVVPLLVIEQPLWLIGLGYFAMHLVGGFTLSIVFQLAHVVDGPEFPRPDKKHEMNVSWAEHQLMTTANFSAGKELATFITGGLNHQVEHHLFPRICHIHYPKLAPIVRQCAQDHGLPYYESPTFLAAAASHARLLKKAGSTVLEPPTESVEAGAVTA